MKRYIYTTFLAILSLQATLQAQNLFGDVLDTKKVPLPSAIVVWAGTTTGAQAGTDGQFSIPFPLDTTQLPLRLVAIYDGVRDTFLIDDLHSFWTLELPVQITLQEVLVLDNKTGAYISVLQPMKTEVINRSELSKAACCDLAGCFETQSTVQPTTTNILTNAKELRILGLSGVYNQVLLDGLPLVQGLSYTYGTGTIPGSMLDNIWVVKGANSVLQGYEGMVGQISIFPREGSTAEPFTADVLVNSFGEQHLNVALGTKKKLWSNYLALHISLPGGRWDRDGDDFLDLPLLTRYSAYNKWRYRKENEVGWSALVGARYVDESRVGGQKDFDAARDKGTTNAYGQTVRFRQPEVLTKSGYRFDVYQKITLSASLSGHTQNSWFGLTKYDANQKLAYANLQYELFWGKDKVHDLKIGVSYRYLDIDEDINFASADTLQRTYAGKYRQSERIPGTFVENIFHFADERWVWVVGARGDHLPSNGWFFTPRTMLKFAPNQQLDIRASAGTGWRTVRLFSENIGLLVGNRNILFAEPLQPEESWNVGVNATQRFKWGSMDFIATVDYYHTQFQNQFFPDYDTDPNLAIIANYTQKSVSNGLQLECSASWGKRLSLRGAYNFLDVSRRLQGEKWLLPFNPRHKLLGVVTFRTPNERWQFDTNIHWYGQQRLPDTRNNPEPLQRPDYSAAFTIVNLQARYQLKFISFFAGCENVFDFRQARPILGWEQPFARGFDPSFAWGPMRGREFYVGCNYKLAKPINH